MELKKILGAIFLTLVAASGMAANTAESAVDAPPPVGAARNAAEKDRVLPPIAAVATPRVAKVYRFIPEGESGDELTARLNDRIRVRVDNYQEFAAGNDARKIQLFFDGMELKGSARLVRGGEKPELEFVLRPGESFRNLSDQEVSEQKRIWATVFGFRNGLKRSAKFAVSVGLTGGEPLPSDAKLVVNRMGSNADLLVFSLVLALLVAVYVWAGKNGAFRDVDHSADGAPLSGEQKSGRKEERGMGAWSLARLQMGWWFFWVVCAFLYIWLAVGWLSPIPDSVLALIGIASGTALGAVAIDANKRGGHAADLTALEQRRAEAGAEKDALETKAGISQQDGAKSKVDTVAKRAMSLEAEIQTIESKIARLQSQAIAVSTRGWVRDIFWDAAGISFHRLQMAIWTIVLGVVFIKEVMSSFALPEFDATLLALMGISSGTYLGFKFPEQQPIAAKPPQTGG